MERMEESKRSRALSMSAEEEEKGMSSPEQLNCMRLVNKKEQRMRKGVDSPDVVMKSKAMVKMASGSSL